MRHAAGFAEAPLWSTVGQVLPLDAPEGATPRVRAPGGERVEPVLGRGGTAVALDEPGFYEVEGASDSARRVVAVNVDPAESDLTSVPAATVLAAATGEAAAGANGVSESLTPEDRERRQRIWWYLLGLAAALLAAETVLSNRLSRAARPAA